ncbi:hybrid sensor histidine kinase/response regulator [Salinirubrum litoreum]|uniref:histidine kinase n=1 Tax=Salinirubrum litoreum TaxID=1126234 RepID=A0ABD5RA53_9EURY|nr:PAS domain S-box protein [Salinirubrum litoreum]
MTREIRVLHVDDSPEFADLTATYLERVDERFTVETATDGEDGLDRFRSATFDCVVSDHEMPGRSGIELLEAIREERPDVPFLLFTGKGSEEVASAAISAGVTDYLQKDGGTEQFTVLANRISNAVEQRRAREAAARTERRLRELSENTPDVLWMFSHDWSDLLFVNSAYEDVYGRPRAGLEADPSAFVDAVHPDDREIVESAMTTLSGGDEVEVEYRVDPNHDFERTVWVYGKPIVEDGEVVRVAGFSREITERKRREEQLAEERAINEQSLDALDDIYYLVGPDGDLRRWNETVVEVTGYADEELAALNVLELFDAADAERVYRAVENVLTAGSGRVEAKLITADGERVPYEFTGSRFVGPDGDLRGVIGVGRDVSERREYERELERQNARLADFAAVVSHDLRNPLNVASGRVDLAVERDDTGHLPPAVDALDRMEALIDDLLTVAHEGDLVSDIEAVSLRASAERSWATVETADATLDVRTDAVVRADDNALQQLFENLFSNAVTHAGRDARVVVAEHPDGFAVADDGPGIPPEDRASVFEATYSTASKGNGLGLAIVREVVEGHGWSVSVEESDAGGARFVFTGLDRQP